MSEPAAPMLRVRNWDSVYENNRSREMKRTDWFPAPNDLSAYAYVELVSHEQGAAHFGALECDFDGGVEGEAAVRPGGEGGWSAPQRRITRACYAAVPSRGAGCDRSPPGNRAPGSCRCGFTRNQQLRIAPWCGKAAGPCEETAGGCGRREGNRTSSSRREWKRKEGNRTRRDEFATEHSGAGSDPPDFPKKGDDEEKPGKEYATPDDELKAIYQSKAGSRDNHLGAGCDSGESRARAGVTMGEFVAEVKETHVRTRGAVLRAFFGISRSGFRAQDRSPHWIRLLQQKLRTRAYRCPLCFSTDSWRGRAARWTANKSHARARARRVHRTPAGPWGSSQPRTPE